MTMVSTRTRLLVVEDDAEMRSLLGQLLEADGYDVRSVCDSRDAIKAVAAEQPDLVLLDIMLGEVDGRDVLKELLRMSDVPVVFLTARSHEIDKIAGLKLGADDYIVKPFSPGELAARIESVLRRCRRPAQRSQTTDFGGLRIDFLNR